MELQILQALYLLVGNSGTDNSVFSTITSAGGGFGGGGYPASGTPGGVVGGSGGSGGGGGTCTGSATTWESRWNRKYTSC